MKKYTGLLFATIIIAAWMLSLIVLLRANLAEFPWLSVPGLLLQTFLYTGIFITAHDAIHGSIVKGWHRFNTAVGAFCLFVYALFPFHNVREKHFEHHRYPGTLKDPDYHNGRRPGFWAWYFNFLLTYITWWQIFGMALIFNLLHHLLNIPIANLLLFWVAPALLSTLQLFYFGTYLPHREPKGGYDNRHHAKSNDYTVFWSFMTCYHFGYHWEHHEYPGTPWWGLPEKRHG